MKMMTMYDGGTHLSRAAQMFLAKHGYTGMAADRAHRMMARAVQMAAVVGHGALQMQQRAEDGAPMLLVSGIVAGLVVMATTIGLGFQGSL